MLDPTRNVGGAPRPTIGEDELAVEPLPAVLPGSHIARYVVLERIGAGGMGVVYAAYDPELDRKVAIKLLQSDADTDKSSIGRARLLREAQALARLTHPNVVAVHDVGTWAHDGVTTAEPMVFVAMEFVHGLTLGKWLQAGKRTLDEVIGVFAQAGAGLRAAHEAGLLHRDFKPDNVMIGDDGRVRVLDFGLARTAGATPLELEQVAPVSVEISERSARVDSRITRTGTMAGTPAYMAPEQHRGDDLDPRADQFSFCVALWEALCGQRPFGGADRIALALAVCGGKRRAMPANVAIPTRWRRALERGLATDRDARFPDMSALLAELAPPRSRALLVLGVGAFVAATAAVALAATSTPAVSSPCAASGSRMAELWTDGRRATVTEAFVAAHPSLGPATAERVVATLDRYAADWTTASHDACTATHERHEQSEALLDRRVGCLSERLQAMSLITDSFASADAKVVEHAVDATHGLPELARCADTDALLAAIPPPEDPQTAAEVEAIRLAIAQGELAGRLGRYASTYATMEPLLERARATGHGPVVAESEMLAGELARAAGRDPDAVRHLREAMLAAIASGHDRIHVRATTRLASVVGISQSRYEEGLVWASHAAAALERWGLGTPEHADASEMMCELLADKGDTAIALAHCLRTLELSIALWGEDDPHIAPARQALGIVHFVAGRHAEAEAEFEQVAAMTRRDKGDDHPEMAQIANALAGTCFYLRGAAECVGAFERAVAAAERGFGPDHDNVADITNNLALVLVDLGRVDEAEARAKRALEIRRRSATEHPGVAASLGVLGRVAAHRGQTQAANAALDEAIAVYKRTRGTKHPDVMSALRTAATERAKQGDVTLARTYLREAVDIAEALGRPASDIAEIRAELGALGD
jgi:tetratricopeptide (TPR) repeat protein/predicted Ser/Thr protein kinase